MPLDPQCQDLLNAVAAMEMPGFAEMTPEECRQSIVGFTMMMGEPEEVAGADKREVPSPVGPVQVNIYTPAEAGPGPLPVLVWFHSGGFVFGNPDWIDPITRTLANRSGCVVVSVDYPLAPEHPYPAAPEASYAVVQWVAEHAAEIGADPTRLAVGGDSAGGNLTAVMCLMARNRGGPPITLQLMLYPGTDCSPETFDLPSHKENAEGYLLTSADCRYFWDHYLSGGGDPEEAYASPLRAPDLTGLPPALVITAEYDPLRDEGEAYGRRLAEAGVPTEIHRYDGMIHGFFLLPAAIAKAEECMDEVATALRKALGA